MSRPAQGATRPQARRGWAAERAGWACMAAFLAAAGLGAFGGGPLGRSAVRGDADVSVEYQRFTRKGRSETVTVGVPGGLARDGRLQVRLSAGFLDRVRRLEVSPPAVRVRGAGSARAFEFATSGDAQEVHFRFEHERAGVARGELSVAGRRPVALWQLVYP